jgi:tetratricopeptide (TPR) repeat protein
LRALRQIAAIAHGNPMHLTTLVREIHDRGAIRTRPNGEHFLDTTALEALPPIALGPWLAARELAHLDVALVALARVCAVLGDEIDRAELHAVVEAVERRGGATTTIDVDVGLKELAAANVVSAGANVAFRQALLQEGIYATTNEDERRAIHAAALHYWRSKPESAANAERIARHAEAVGDRATAADAFITLGEHAERDHHTLVADQMFQGALRNLDDRVALRARALMGRARARAMQQRVRDSIVDLEEASAIAVEVGDQELQIQIMLEQATALDFHEEFGKSTELAHEATRRVADQQLSERFALEIAFASGRAFFREEDFASAEPILRDTFQRARAAGRATSQIDAGLLLGPALASLGKLDAAEALCTEMIDICTQAGDRFHLCAAHINRTWVWSARGDIDRVSQDLRVVIQLAREGGQAHLERAATYNLAEDLLWQGAHEEARVLANRSLALQEGHGEGNTRLEQVLLARIHAARGDRAALGEALQQLAALPDLTDEEKSMKSVLEMFARGERDWSVLAQWVDSLPVTNRLEMWSLFARELPADLRAKARELAASDPIWSRRIDEFSP